MMIDDPLTSAYIKAVHDSENGYADDCPIPDLPMPWDTNYEHAKAYYGWYGLPIPQGWEKRRERILAE